jgi:uncharacterized phage protein (TIGR01671 family)
MNRIPNYRVWHKIEKRFVDLRSIDFEKENIGYDAYREGNYYDVSSFNDVVFQQWSGFVDAEGKDIYDGDIGSVNFILKHRGVIKFGEYRGKGYYASDAYGWFIDFKFDSYAFVKNWPKNTTVIGNIFENPELLKNE